MNSNRRRKKRVSHGIRAVDIRRGRNGFGFTISGQFPCKLSCVVPGSPADEVGLKQGDYLISVNGNNVVKTLHDEVVHLIGTSQGSLHLQISESYFSDTSDEDCPPATRVRPRYPGSRVRHRHKIASMSHLDGASFSRSANGVDQFGFNETVGQNYRGYHALSESFLHPLRRSPRKRDRIIAASRGRLSLDVDSQQSAEYSRTIQNEEILMRTVVGYLGTIGMPKDTHMIPNSRLQAVRSCIRRLRVEKKVHTLVLFSILREKIILQNPHGMILASYPCDRVTFCGAYADDDKFFGIVTRSSSSDAEGSSATASRRVSASSSCHVFMVDAKMHSHPDHVKRARAFRIECTRSEEESYQCAEFPLSAGPILQAIVKVWGKSNPTDTSSAPGLINADSPSVHEPNASPQPSLASNSSNSDSGIGFRDDALSCADREGAWDYSNCLGAEAFPIELESRPRTSFACGSMDRRFAKGASESSLVDKLCVRAMPTSQTGSPLTKPMDRLSAQVYISPKVNLNFTRSLDDIRDQTDDSRRCASEDFECITFPLDSSRMMSRFGVSTSFHGSESNLSVRTDERSDVKASNRNKRYSMLPYPGYCEAGEEAEESETSHSGVQPSVEARRRSSRRRTGQPQQQQQQQQQQQRQQQSSLQRDGSSGNATSQSCLRSDDREWGSLNDGLAHLDSQGFLRPLPPAEYAAHLAASRHPHPHPPTHQRASRRSEAVASGVSAPGLNSSSGGGGAAGGLVVPGTTRVGGGGGDAESNVRGRTTEGRPVERSEPAVIELSDMVADMGRTSRLDVTGNDGSKGAMGEEVAVGRVESWAMSFERLLRDTAGIHTFAEFLKKEFSHENIYFWVAVQRYKLMFDKETSDGEENITDKEKEERISAAREIYERHLSLSASEPVNVDSQARQFVQDNITRADAKIFAKAEQQIFNLMKYDSYARFLKSPLYKDAAKAENEGRELPFPGGDQVEADLRLEPSTDGRNESTIQKNVGRRKSLLGWGKRSRAKSRESRPRSRTRAPRASSLRRLRPKDQKTSEASESSGQPKTMLPNSTSIRDGSVQSNGSRLSLASSDLALMSRNFSTSQESLPSEKEALANVSCMSVSSAGKENYNGPLCRMILPDQSTTVVPLMPGETIHALVFRLLGKKGLSYSATDVYTINSGVPIDQSKDSLVLSCHEVRVERRVLINFVLPWDKSVPVKAGPGRKLCEVLRPVLNSHNQELQRWQQQHGKTSSRYAYPALKVDHFTAHRGSDETSLSMKTLATNLDNETVVLKFKEGPSNNTLTGKGLLGAKKLDEITNRVFLDLMRSKSVTDADKVPTDDSSSQSSGIVGSLLRRNSIHVDRDFSEKGLSVAASDPDAVLAPPRLFLDDGVGDQPSPSREELYAELKRADKLRLDDQRGLKLNCEIPDFLMGSSGGSGVTDDKENETKSRIVKVDEKDFMRASTKGAFKTSRIEISASSSSIYGDPSSSFETKYDPRKDASALSRLCSDPSDVDFYPFCTDDQSYLNSRNESVGKNAGSSKPTSRLSSQLTPPPLPPKPKVFRAPAFLRPPPPPPPLRREAMDALDYIAPPRPRTVRRSDRLNQTHAFERSGGAGNPLPSISFV